MGLMHLPSLWHILHKRRMTLNHSSAHLWLWASWSHWCDLENHAMTISASMSCVTCFFLYVVVFLMKFRSSFFEVGHTHCNQDQIFCRSLIHLVDKTFSTFYQLCFHLKNSCSLTNYTEHIQFFTYWCVYVDKHLNRPAILWTKHFPPSTNCAFTWKTCAL